jgi:hypothetical protein
MWDKCPDQECAYIRLSTGKCKVFYSLFHFQHIAQTAFRNHNSVMQLHHFHMHALQLTQVMQDNW